MLTARKLASTPWRAWIRRSRSLTISTAGSCSTSCARCSEAFRRSLGAVPAQVRIAVVFQAHAQQHGRRQREYRREHHEKSRERHPERLALVPQKHQRHIPQTKRKGENKYCRKRLRTKCYMAMRTYHARKSRGRPKRFCGDMLVALRAGHGGIPPD